MCFLLLKSRCNCVYDENGYFLDRVTAKIDVSVPIYSPSTDYGDYAYFVTCGRSLVHDIDTNALAHE